MNLELGFTVLEFLIASTIFIIVVLAVYLMYETNQATFAKGEKDADLQQNARVAMDRIVRELRMAGFDPEATPVIETPSTPSSEPCATAILSATATSINFLADVDSDGRIDKAEYTYDSTQKGIKREKWEWARTPGATCTNGWSPSGGAKALAEKISSVTFVYRNASNVCIPNADCTPGTVAAADLGNIRRITISITASDTLPNQEIRSYTMTSEVRPRNLGL